MGRVVDTGLRRSDSLENSAHPLLTAGECDLIKSGELQLLRPFVDSPRFDAVTSETGDTPLHLAAQTGNLAVCDLFIRGGANPKSLNCNGRTPADVAAAAGHGLVAYFLGLIDASPLEAETKHGEDEIEISTADFEEALLRELTIVEEAEVQFATDGLNELIFEPEVDPKAFFTDQALESASGTFFPLIGTELSDPDEVTGSWSLDLSNDFIAGEGVWTSAPRVLNEDNNQGFLERRRTGRRSKRQSVVSTGTTVSIDKELCITWAQQILAKGSFLLDDVDRLITHCCGDGDLEELSINLQRNLEAEGFAFDESVPNQAELWDAKSDTSAEDLADSIETALSRRTGLPGIQRFVMSKADELQLLQPMMRAKQELQLGILASETAVETILQAIDGIRDGSRDPTSVSLRTIYASRSDHAETVEVMVAADALRSWFTTSRAMDGKRKRDALAALEALDLSLAFHKELVGRLELSPVSRTDACQLEAQILVFESVTEHLIREHLPYVRRFASRNVNEGEDPEDVFQVAFEGLQRCTRRFDPERGHRFLIYSTYWMRQAISRWRADEGAMIRIPVHRHEKVTMLDRALARLDVRLSAPLSDLELAEELEWRVEEVRQFRDIPREAEYPASIDDWDNLSPEPSESNVFDRAETERIVNDSLAELPERQAEVIRMRFGIGRDSEMTLEEIGQIYGVTRERIRQIEAKGLDRLSHPVRKRRLQELLGM